MQFTDTHCHIHEPEFFPDGGDAAYTRAMEAGVYRLICVGTSVASSKQAVSFATTRDGVYSSVGIHPHDAVSERPLFNEFATWCKQLNDEKLVAVGEVGLDYHYMNSPRREQLELLEQQLDLALELKRPVIFHVREAFDDFWPLLGNFPGIRGVLHSFTDSAQNLETALSQNLFIGVNGIATFAPGRDEITTTIPLEKMLLETDAPFLTPAPNRGKVNEPRNIPLIASYVAALRGTTVEELSQRTEQAAADLFF